MRTRAGPERTAGSMLVAFGILVAVLLGPPVDNGLWSIAYRDGMASRGITAAFTCVINLRKYGEGLSGRL